MSLLTLGVGAVAAGGLPAFATSYDRASITIQSVGEATNYASGPSGSTTAHKYTEDTGNSGHLWYQSLADTSAGLRTEPVYMKAEGGATHGFVMLVVSAGRYNVVVDLATGVVTDTETSGSPTSTGYTVHDAGGGWWRIAPSADHAGGTIYIVAGISDSGTPTYDGTLNPTYVGNGTRAIGCAQ